MQIDNQLKDKKIYFFCPDYNVGGVQILFLRIVKNLIEKGFSNIYIIDYEDGFMSKNRTNNMNVKHFFFNKPLIFNDSELIVFQSSPLWIIPNNIIFSPSTQVVFWTLHPYNFLGLASKSVQFKNLFLKKLFNSFLKFFIYNDQCDFIKLINRKKSLFFIDEENISKTENFFNLKLENPKIIPLILDNLDINTVENTFEKNLINCICLGRVVLFKFYILKHTLYRLNKYAIETNKIINFHIIGSGDNTKELLDYAYGLEKLNIKHVDYIDSQLIGEYLSKNNIQAGFGMGTSCIDLAKYGLVTFALDYSYQEINKCYRYKLLCDLNTYSLGSEITRNDIELKCESLELTLDSLQEQYLDLKTKTLGYVRDFYRIEKVINIFISSLEKSELVYSDLKIFRRNNIIFNNLKRIKRLFNK